MRVNVHENIPEQADDLADDEDNPRNFCLTDVAYPDKPSQTETTESTQKVVTPWLDLYWKTNWGGHQILVANAGAVMK